MKPTHRIERVLAVILILAVTILAACGAEEAADPAGENVDVTMDGAVLLEARCTQCHELDRVTTATHTEAEWDTIVEDMIGKGAELNEQEKEALVDYLAEVHGP